MDSEPVIAVPLHGPGVGVEGIADPVNQGPTGITDAPDGHISRDGHRRYHEVTVPGAGLGAYPVTEQH